jgi:hypothetical protein
VRLFDDPEGAAGCDAAAGRGVCVGGDNDDRQAVAERETDPDKPPAHSPAPEFGIMTRGVALIHVKRLRRLRG